MMSETGVADACLPRPRGDLLIQRDILIEPFGSVESAVRAGELAGFEDDDAVILVSDRGKLYDLNLTAALIWESMTGERSADETVNLMADCFNVSAQEARRDLDGFLRYVHALGLLEPR